MSLPVPDDRALLQHIASGDQAAFYQLYSAYYTRLWRYVWYQLDGNAGWTEEVLQDIFMAIWRRAASFRGEAQPASWIFQIAHFLVSNARRDHSRRAEGRLDMVAEEDDEDHLWSEASFEAASIDRLTLIAAIDELSAKHQAVIDLIFIQGFTLDETALILGVPLGTVKSRVLGARRALLKTLGTTRIVRETQI